MKYIFSLLFGFGILFVATQSVSATTLDQLINPMIQDGGTGNSTANIDLPKLPGGDPIDATGAAIQKIINMILALVGSLTVIMIIYGGFQYITTFGEKNDNAKKTLLYAIGGLAAVLLSYAVVTNVIRVIYKSPQPAKYTPISWEEHIDIPCIKTAA